ncbi:MAG: LysR family transcriptional regulator [Clostridia bacterium]|nr:LysR family transcriptional regulator [Clostridia bacterium]
MNLKHAQYVLTILREGSFTAAARKLYVSQPSLSQTIKQLEATLGTPVFNRTSETLKLTYAGQRYVDAAQRIMIIYDNLLSEIEDMKQEVHGRLRLGVSMQRGMNLLPLVLPVFMEKYPRVEIELEEYGSDKLEKMVLEGSCDIALVTTNPKVNQLEYILIETEQLVLMASNTTDIARRFVEGTRIEITEAVNEAFVSLKPGHSIRVIQDRLFAHYNMSPKILLESDSFETAKHITARTNAVMITPYVYIENVPVLRSLVKCFPIQNSGYERDFYLCHRKGLYFTRYMSDFLSMIKTRIGTYRMDATV